jgi:hypothetical protein
VTRIVRPPPLNRSPPLLRRPLQRRRRVGVRRSSPATLGLYCMDCTARVAASLATPEDVVASRLAIAELAGLSRTRAVVLDVSTRISEARLPARARGARRDDSSGDDSCPHDRQRPKARRPGATSITACRRWSYRVNTRRQTLSA